VKGLPETAWRDSRLQLASEKQGGPLVCISRILLWREREKKRGDSFLWESRCEDCVCGSYRMTLKCNTQRASPLDTLLSRDWYNSIPITLMRTALQNFSFQGQKSSQSSNVLDTTNF
jgi:hypothetical protein